MKIITEAIVCNLKDESLKGLIYLDDGKLFLKTPSNKIFEVAAVNNTERVAYVLQTTVELFKDDGARSSMVVGGEVDIARSLYNCIQKENRDLVEIEKESEVYDKNIGVVFDVIKALTKEDDERIQCAYKYKD